MRIAFRVDASVEMGTGHMRRCLSLAAAVQQGGGEVVFVTRSNSLLIPQTPFEQVYLAPAAHAARVEQDDPPHAHWLTAGWAVDAAETATALAAWQPDWVVTDHYGIDARWHNHVRGALTCRMAAIDDLGDRRHGVDALIDHNWHHDHREKYHGLLPEQCHILGGPKYAMLGQTYAMAPRYIFFPEVRSIGVFLGGTDHLDQTSVVLDCIASAEFAGSVEIATTSSNPNLAKLQARVGADDSLSLLLDAPDLAAFFARHDLQVGAGGGATWERFCIGAPSILISFAHNHDSVLIPLGEQQVAAVLPYGWMKEELARAIARFIKDAELRRHMVSQSRAMVDGRGAERSAVALLGKGAQVIDIRAVQLGDAKFMYDCRNHPLIRSVSRQTQEIDYDAHVQWLEQSLKREDRIILIGQTLDGTPLGVVRFDCIAEGEFEVSIYIDPERSGQGLGGRLLRHAEESFARKCNSPVDILAVTMPGNVASERLFIKGGYRKTEIGFRKTITS
jgi:UDP-2,4-diacetamido-2,4,6-trideoxy-beta-L-altropyranose hydrolase